MRQFFQKVLNMGKFICIYIIFDTIDLFILYLYLLYIILTTTKYIVYKMTKKNKYSVIMPIFLLDVDTNF